MWQNNFQSLCVAAALGATFCLILYADQEGLVARVGTSTRTRGAQDHLASCPLEFLRYQPSHWELHWRTNIEELQKRVCPTMLEESHLVDMWMEGFNSSFHPNVCAADLPFMQDSEVFSHFHYRDVCTGEEVILPIEPLVGLLRHPTVHPDCTRKDRPDFVDRTHSPGKVAHIENKGYILIQPSNATTITRQFPGRKYLFDLGTGRYHSGSLPWFTSVFERKGIVFDEIYGWEAKNISQQEYWDTFPAESSYKMHFRNVPCVVDPESPQNPLNIVRKLYRPGDFVAFKLDIDNEPVERALMEQLDARTIPMIAEFFFEQHFDNVEMRRYFGTNLHTTLSDVVHAFHRLRSQGLRIHYWP